MLTLLHTSPVHVATFDALRDRIAPGATLNHVVREELLMRAMSDGVTDEIADETVAAIEAAEGPVLCTCTTLGVIAEKAGAIRIDRPLMQAAAAMNGAVILAYCLESTAKTSLDLLNEEMARADNHADVVPVFVESAWPFFEAGDIAGFHADIATSVRVQLADDTACIVLAQASMAGASELLADLKLPVLSSPELALRAGLDL